MWDAVVAAIVDTLIMTLTLSVEAGVKGVRGLCALVEEISKQFKRK